jgi:endonuclease/exonuclease/phosphatase family metal-dependent hydrolase
LVELALFKYVYESSGNERKEVYILSVYKHPSLGKQEFKQQILDFLKKNLGTNYMCYNIVMIGDFNYDFNKPANSSIDEYMKQIGFERVLKNQITFEKFDSQPDCVFKSSNFGFNLENIKTYRTYFSDHHAVWFELDFDAN